MNERIARLKYKFHTTLILGNRYFSNVKHKVNVYE